MRLGTRARSDPTRDADSTIGLGSTHLGKGSGAQAPNRRARLGIAHIGLGTHLGLGFVMLGTPLGLGWASVVRDPCRVRARAGLAGEEGSRGGGVVEWGGGGMGVHSIGNDI